MGALYSKTILQRVAVAAALICSSDSARPVSEPVKKSYALPVNVFCHTSGEPAVRFEIKKPEPVFNAYTRRYDPERVVFVLSEKEIRYQINNIANPDNLQSWQAQLEAALEKIEAAPPCPPQPQTSTTSAPVAHLR